MTNGESENDAGYLADGNQLTAEEHAFLRSNLPTGKNASLEEDIM